jgi:hypothetical protein
MWRAIVVLGVLGLIGFVGFRTLFGEQTVSWHQRLTVIVDTPNGEVRGAAVTEITKTETMGSLVPMEARGVHSKVRGEAVAVEVLPGRWLFALLDGRGDGLGKAEYLANSAFGLLEAAGSDGKRSYAAAMAKLREQPFEKPSTIPPSDYPLLVTFDDIARPETVVDPSDLAATFGQGMALKAMTLEVTEEGVTEGYLRSLLGWLGPYPEQALGPATGGTTNIPFYRSVHMGDFIRELP